MCGIISFIQQGKIRYYGVSVERVDEALQAITYPNVQSVQIIFNMFRLKPAEQFFAAAREHRIGVLASCVAAYYYLRIVKLMYFDEPAPAFDRPSPVARVVLAFSALMIILFVFAPSPITNAAMAAAQSLF